MRLLRAALLAHRQRGPKTSPVRCYGVYLARRRNAPEHLICRLTDELDHTVLGRTLRYMLIIIEPCQSGDQYLRERHSPIAGRLRAECRSARNRYCAACAYTITKPSPPESAFCDHVPGSESMTV